MRYSRDHTYQVINNESFQNKNPNPLLCNDNEPSFFAHILYFILFFCVFNITLLCTFPRYLS